MTSSTCSNPQDPKESTSHDKEPPEIEYAEGVDDLTVDFLKTKFRQSHLVSMGSSIIDEEVPEYRDNYLDKLGSVTDLDLIGKGEGKEEGLPLVNDCEKNTDYKSIDKDEKEWYEEDPDETCEEMMTSNAVFVVGFLVGCGFLGYLFMRWFG